MEDKIKQTNPTLHKYLFTVTTFSKLLAMIIFITLPFVGFYLGMKYQEATGVNTSVVSQVKKITQPIPTPISLDTSNWKTYTNTKVGFIIKYNQKYHPIIPTGGEPIIYATGNEDNTTILFTTDTEEGFSLDLFPYTGTLNNLPTFQDKYRFSDDPTLSLIPEQIFFDGQNRSVYVVLDKSKKIIDIFFMGKNYGFSLTAGGNDLKQVLSTFKFTQ